MPTLDELLASDPVAKAEHDKRLGEAKNQGIEEKQKEIDRVYPLITAEGASAALVQEGLRALKEGDDQVPAFVAIAGYETRQNEAAKAKETEKEQKPDTSAAPNASDPNRPKNAADMKGLAANLKTKVL